MLLAPLLSVWSAMCRRWRQTYLPYFLSDSEIYLARIFDPYGFSINLYAASAWWGFTTTTDRHVSASRHLSNETSALVCVGRCFNTHGMVYSADDALFERILYNFNHILHSQRDKTLSQTSTPQQSFTSKDWNLAD